jgi:hypothetical protein
VPPNVTPPPRWPTTSNTVRPAEKGASSTSRIEPAVERRTVDGLVTLSIAAGKPMRRKQARAVVLAYASDHGPDLNGWSHWLRNEWGIADPTGESVASMARQHHTSLDVDALRASGGGGRRDASVLPDATQKQGWAVA